MSNNNNNFYTTNKKTGLALTASRDIMFFILSIGTAFMAYKWVSLNSSEWNERTAAFIFATSAFILTTFFSLLTIVRSGSMKKYKYLKIGAPLLLGASVFMSLVNLVEYQTLSTIGAICLGLITGFGASFAVDKVYQNASLSFWRTIIVTGWGNLEKVEQKIFTMLTLLLVAVFGYATFYFSQTVVPEMAETIVTGVDEEHYDKAYSEASKDEKERLATLEKSLNNHKKDKRKVYRDADQILYDSVHRSEYVTPHRIAAWKGSPGWLKKQKDKGNKSYVASVKAGQRLREKKINDYEYLLDDKQTAYDNYLSKITGNNSISEKIQRRKETKLSERDSTIDKWTGLGSQAVLWALIFSGMLTPISMLWVKASNRASKYSLLETFSFFEIIMKFLQAALNEALIDLAKDLGVHGLMTSLESSPTPSSGGEEKKEEKTEEVKEEITETDVIVENIKAAFSGTPQLELAGTGINVPLEQSESIGTNSSDSSGNESEQNAHNSDDKEQIATEQNTDAEQNENEDQNKEQNEAAKEQIVEQRTKEQSAKEFVLDVPKNKKRRTKGVKPLPTLYKHGFERSGDEFVLWYQAPNSKNKSTKRLKGSGGVLDTLGTNRRRLQKALAEQKEQIEKTGQVQKATQNKVVRNEAWVLFLTHCKEQLELLHQNAEHTPQLYPSAV